MVKRVDFLTDDQKAQIPAHVEKWNKKGLCCDPADLPTFEANANLCYGFADLEWHNNVIPAGNPKRMSITGPLMDAAFKAIYDVTEKLINGDGKTAAELKVAGLIEEYTLGLERTTTTVSTLALLLDRREETPVDSSKDDVVETSALTASIASAILDHVTNAATLAMSTSDIAAMLLKSASGMNLEDSTTYIAHVSANLRGLEPDLGDARRTEQSVVEWYVRDCAFELVLASINANAEGDSPYMLTVTGEKASADKSMAAYLAGELTELTDGEALDLAFVAIAGARKLEQRIAIGAAVAELYSDVVRVINDGDIRSVVSESWWKRMGGQWWLAWQAYTSFFREVCDLELDGDIWERDIAYARAQESVGWWWPHTHFIVVTDRPKVVKTVQVRESGWGSHQMHCDDGPALGYRDGWNLWFIDGIQVDEQIVMRPETLTIQQIQDERNVEKRRVMRQQYGDGKYLTETGAVVVDMDHEGCEEGAAPRALMRDHEDSLFLVGTDGSTGRSYFMPIENAKTCAEAHREICGFDDSKIRFKS